MIKNVKWIFVICFTSSFFFSSFAGKESTTEGVVIGDSAPLFTLTTSNQQIVHLDELRGSYVVLSFWASYDAASRMQNALLNHAVASTKNVQMVSVSFDQYESVFKETIKKDQLSTSAYVVGLAGPSSELYQQYQLSRGFRNYLLDERGVIIAKNVDASQLSSYIQ